MVLTGSPKVDLNIALLRRRRKVELRVSVVEVAITPGRVVQRKLLAGRHQPCVPTAEHIAMRERDILFNGDTGLALVIRVRRILEVRNLEAACSEALVLRQREPIDLCAPCSKCDQCCRCIMKYRRYLINMAVV